MKSYEQEEVLRGLDALGKDITDWATRKGFHTLPSELEELMAKSSTVFQYVEKLVKSQKIALMHSELSEHLEEVRKPGQPIDTDGITNEEAELADLIIRALNYAGQNRLRIGLAVGKKMAKNEGRPYMHGKAF